jgi:hypothetical protein
MFGYLAIKENIDINDSRSLRHSADSPHFSLDREASLKQGLGRQFCPDLTCQIDEIGLIGDFHRFGFVERRDRE